MTSFDDTGFCMCTVYSTCLGIEDAHETRSVHSKSEGSITDLTTGWILETESFTPDSTSSLFLALAHMHSLPRIGESWVDNAMAEAAKHDPWLGS